MRLPYEKFGADFRPRANTRSDRRRLQAEIARAVGYVVRVSRNHAYRFTRFVVRRMRIGIGFSFAKRGTGSSSSAVE